MTDDDDEVDTAISTVVADGDAGSMASLLGAVAATAAPTLVPGTVVGGQYRVERAAGAGATGVVYLAHDLRLDRAVAIKLGAARSTRALARLQREASALGRLSHPNVVVVHQVGAHDGRVFIAMEYVAGGTARAWLAAAPRTGPAIIALYAAAGDGLAAAHGAGLIHRDFKPDNLLVGDDGRPRVADFGLVRAAEDDDDGAVVGTPAYMPPEQRAGGAVDGRADQYAFCASLAEALERAEPRARVPRHVADAVRRGQLDDRDARWPAMAPLLAALRRDPSARRRRVALVVVSATIAAAIAVPLALRAGAAPTPCTDGPSIIAASWSPAHAARLATALGPRAWPTVQARIDGYARAWSLGHRDACRATRIARSQTEDLLDRRMYCLGKARAAFDATLAVLDDGGPAIAAGAVAAVGQLPDLDDCADTTRLARYQPLPSDRGARIAIDVADALIAEAQASAFRPDDRDRLGKAERAVAATRAAGWAAGTAHALELHAGLIDEAGRAEEARGEYREAARLALASGHDSVAAMAYADLSWNLALAARFDEADLALEVGRGLIDHGGTDPWARRRVLAATATLAVERGRPVEALASTRAILALTEADPDATPELRAGDQHNLAVALGNSGDPAGAARAALRAVELAEATLGPDHPDVGRYLVQLGIAQQHMSELGPAAAALERALAILETWYGPDHPRLDPALGGLGYVRRRQGRGDEARALWQRRLAIARATQPTHVATIQSDLAMLMIDAGDLAGAAQASDEALAVLEAQYGPTWPNLANTLIVVGYVARAQGRIDDALRDFGRALALVEPGFGALHPTTINFRIELARTQLVADQPAAARATLEVALDQARLTTELPPELVVEGCLIVADLDLAQGRRAEAHRRAALASTAADAVGGPALVAMVATWRAAHPR